jgi:aerobic carbon-monoxide dehydrogenase large subunit
MSKRPAHAKQLSVEIEKTQFVGQHLKLREALRLLKGQGKFVDDLSPDGLLYMAIYRSPYAHAKIMNVDVEEARRQEGVVAVLTPSDVAFHSKPLKTRLSYPKTKIAEHSCLAQSKVRYVGEPIVAVIATSRYQAVDALDYVKVDFERLSAVVDMEDALAPSSPLLYEEWGDNETMHLNFKYSEPARPKADRVLKFRIDGHRYTGTPIEARAYLAQYNQTDRTLLYYASTQNPHIARTLLADTLSIPENRIRVIMPDVGGGFGLKHPLYPEELLVCIASKLTGRPVKWTETRTENLMTMTHAREQRHFIEVEVKGDGTIIALKDKIIVDLGVAMPSAGPYSAFVTAHFLTGPYKIRNYEYEVIGVATNKTPYGAYRGFGKADSNYVMERIIDRVARTLGIDPAEVRMRNLIDSYEFPYETPTGSLYDSGTYKECMKALLDLIDYPGIKKRKAELERESKKALGIGLAFSIEPTATSVPASFISSYDSVNIRIDPSGTVSVNSGAAPQGHGYETVIPQLAADALGVKMEDVFAYHGDTATTPYGLGSYSSRFAVVLAPAIQTAARKLKKKMIDGAAFILKEDPDSLVVEEGVLFSKKSKRSMTVPELARKFYTAPYELPPDMEPGLDVTTYYAMKDLDFIPDASGRANIYRAYPFGACAAIIEVDLESGQIAIDKYAIVHDCGPAINPAIVEGQVIGGIAQGIGGALYEEVLYDRDGNLLTTTFMDYLIPTANEMPKITVSERTVTPSPFVPGGFKGVGEIGTIGPEPLLANALEDALDEMVVRTPLKPEYVKELIKKHSMKASLP